MLWLLTQQAAEVEQSSWTIKGIAGLWPMMFLILKVMAGMLVATPFLMWPAATYARRKAYGPGGGRR
jgi:hypothetical protein